MTPHLHASATRRSALKAGAAAGLGALLLGASACSEGRSSSSKSLTFPAPSLDALLGNAPLHTAMAQGMFKPSGQKVTFADVVGTDVIRTIQTSALLGVAGALPAIVAYSKGATDLRIIGPVYSAAQTTFIAPANSPLESLADLKSGMKIGAAVPASPPTYFAEVAARKAGLEPGRDIEVLALGRAPDAWTAAKNGIVDLAWSNPPFDTHLLETGDAKLLGTGADLIPEWIDLVLVTTQSKAEADADTIRALRTAIAKAQSLIVSEPPVAGNAWAKEAGLEEAVAVKALEGAPRTAWATSVTADGLTSVINAGAEMGLIANDLDISSLVSTEFGAS